MADKIMVIEDGQVKEYGTKEDVLPTLFQQKTGRMCGQREEAHADGTGR